MPRPLTENRAKTFSFLEVAIGLLVVGTLASVAIPWWLSDRIVENEQRAVEVLSDLAKAQNLFKERSKHRTFGSLDELLGRDEGRDDVEVTPVTLKVDGSHIKGSVLSIGGYYVVVYLSDLEGFPTTYATEPTHDFFVAYAWPISYGYSGRAVFAVSSDGRVLRNDNAENSFSGRGDRPIPTLAFAEIKMPFQKPPVGVLQLRWNAVEP